MIENLKLLNAIRANGLKQKEFAHLVGESASNVSRVIRGWVNLDEANKLKYAKVLGCNVEDIFTVDEEEERAYKARWKND